MADNTKIGWATHTWNPIAGCDVVSPGCTNCYAMRRTAPRLSANPATPQYHGTVEKTKAGYIWTGKIGIAGDAVWRKPFTWRKPAMIFANSTSDLGHPNVPDYVVDRVFQTAFWTPRHIYQILTKRPWELVGYLEARRSGDPWAEAADEIANLLELQDHPWALEPRNLPLRNIWLGCSVEDQKRADERREPMRRLAEAGWLTWVSYEPALGPVDWSGWEFLRWLVAGGESGPRARPEDHTWYRTTLDWCRQTDTRFFMKQIQSPNKPGKVWTLKESFPADLQVQEYPTEAFNG